MTKKPTNSALLQLRASLSKIIVLDDNEFSLFQAQTQLVRLKKKDFLLRQGDTCKHAYFLAEGCLRYFHVIEGKEHTGQFFFENSWYTDFESFLSDSPSKQYIQALEDTILLQITKNQLLFLYQELPKLERFGRLMAENAFLGLRNRTEMFSLLSPEERYRKLVMERPKLLQRIPQHYIASYLGLQPQSLSRIRHRLSKQT